jgi:hypothetical protein
LPATVDDVFSNNFTVYVDGNYRVLTVQNLSATGITLGGRFILNDTVSLTANIIGGTTDVNCVQFLSAAPAFCTIVGSLCANNPAARGPGALSNNSTGTVTVIGNGLGRTRSATGTTVSPTIGYVNNLSSGTMNFFGDYLTSNVVNIVDNRCIWNGSTGTINLVGNLLSALAGDGTIFNNSTGTVNITGNIVGGQTAGTEGIRNSGAGNIRVIGNVSGGSSLGIRNNAGGSVVVFGNILGGTGTGVDCGAITNSSFGTVTVVGDVSGGNIVNASNNNNRGIVNASSGTVSVTGSIIGQVGNGLINSSSGTINIIGNIRSTGAGVGISTINGNVNILGNVNAGPSNYGIAISNGFLSLTGNVVGGTAGSGVYGIHNPDFGYVTVYGNVSGGNGLNASGIQNGQGTALYCTAVVYGDVFGGAGSGAPGVNQIGRYSQAYIYGNVYGGVGSGSQGVGNNPNSTQPSFIYVQGNAYGGTGGVGANNAPGGFVYIQGSAVGNGFGLNSTAAGISTAFAGVAGSQNAITIVGGLSCGSRGLWPTTGNVFVRPIANSTCSFFTSALSAGPNIALFTSLSANIVPPVSSVRLGTVYNLGDNRGTCAMPSVSSVLQGVAVDNSMGIVALQPQTIWDYSVLSATDVNSLGGRLKNVATVQSVGQQLTALN